MLHSLVAHRRGLDTTVIPPLPTSPREPASGRAISAKANRFHRQDSDSLNRFYFHYTEPEERGNERKTEGGKVRGEARGAKLKDSRSPAYTQFRSHI